MAIAPKEKKVSDWFSRTINIKVRSSADGVFRDEEPRKSPNDRLTEALWSAVVEYSPVWDLNTDERPEERERRLLLDVPPTPIGQALENIFRQKQRSAKRLKRVVDCYTILLQTTLMITLSELAKETYEEPPAQGLVEVINAYCFELSDRSIYNTLHTTLSIFSTSDIPLYVTELAELVQALEQPSLRQGQAFFENQKNARKKTAEEIERDCSLAEEHLVELFQVFGFLYKYTWRSIRRVLRQPWEEKGRPIYNMEFIRLHQARNRMEVQTEQLDYPLPANSVVLISPANEGSKNVLHLFPFVVDYNASVASNQNQQSNADLYLFSQKSKDGYIFTHSTLTRNMLFNRDAEERMEIPIALRHFELWLKS